MKNGHNGNGHDPQGSFNFGPIRRTIQERFLEYHQKNPHVYTSLVGYARRAKQQGFDKYAIDTLYEVLRWYTQIETSGTDYKLCNDFRSRYARLIMQQEPDLANFFDLRELRRE
jgi:hypothetical protein